MFEILGRQTIHNYGHAEWTTPGNLMEGNLIHTLGISYNTLKCI